MSSAIWAGGDKAAGTAAVKTKAAACFVTQPDGTKVLDQAQLLQWVLEELNKIPYDAGVDTNGALQYLTTADAPGWTRLLASNINPAAWAGNPNWPTNSGSIGSNSQGNVSTLAATLQRQTNELGALANALPAQMDAAALGYFGANVEGGVSQGVTRIIETRTYVFTHVNDWGEESAPCPAAALIDVDQNDTVLVTRPALPGGRNIVSWRLYRSQASKDTALYEFVVELPAATASYVDSLVPTALGEALPTITWDEPPSDLRGLKNLPNGIMTGYSGNIVCFSEPYYYYAWPVPYQVTLPVPIVELGPIGQSLIVLTRGKPYVINGTDSSAMVAMPLDADQACVSRRSVVSTSAGVIYASPDGICVATPQGVQVLTGPAGFNLFTREDWQALHPETIFAAMAEGSYHFWTGTGGAQQGWALHLGSGKLTKLDAQGSAAFYDTPTDALYLASGTAIKALFTDSSYRTGTWRSKRMVLAAPAGFAWVHVESDFPAPVTVRVYCDGALFFTISLTSLVPQRFPVGRCTEVEIEIETAARVTAVVLAGSTAELRSV